MQRTLRRQDGQLVNGPGVTASEILRALAELHKQYLSAPHSDESLICAVRTLMDLTGSTSGVLGELMHSPQGPEWMTLVADISSRGVPVRGVFSGGEIPDELSFQTLDHRLAEVVATGDVVVADGSPRADRPSHEASRQAVAGSLCDGSAFLGIPLQAGDELIGVIGLAGNEAGYSVELADDLAPLTAACATFFTALRAAREPETAYSRHTPPYGRQRKIANLSAEAHVSVCWDSLGTVHSLAFDGNVPGLAGCPDTVRLRPDDLCRGFLQRLHPDDRQSLIGLVSDASSCSSDVMIDQTVRWHTSDDELRHLRIRAVLQHQPGDEGRATVYQAVGCLLDVTREVQLEAELQHTEQRHQAILLAVPDLIFLMTSDGRFVDSWSADESRLVAPPDRFLGKLHRDFLPSEVCSQWDQAAQRALSTGEVGTFEYTLDLSDGLCWFEARVVALNDGQESLLTVARDITERRRAEEAEARQFSLLTEITSSARELIFVKDTQRRLLFLNEAAAKLIGHSREECYGKTIEELIPALPPNTVEDSDRKVLETGKSVVSEQRMPSSDGERVFMTSKSPWRNQAGQLIGLVGIAQDVTELIRIHRELEQSRQFAERITDASPHIIYVFDIAERKILYANRQLTDVLGFTPEDIQEMGSDILPKLIHPEELKKAHHRITDWDRVRDGEVLENEYRFRTADGQWRWMLCRTTVFQRSEDGRVQQVIGTAQDITEQVEAKLALTESEARLRGIIESEPECVKLLDREGRLLEMNAAGLRLVGAECLDDVAGHQVIDLIAPEYRQQYREFHELVCAGQPGTLEIDIITASGGRRRLETHAVPLKFGPDGEIGHLAVSRDVTDVRRAEELIAQQQSQLLHVSRLSSLGQMAAAISHEVTQPLSAISNYASACRLLLRRPEPNLETFARHIESIAEQAHRAGDTLDRIRSFIRGDETPKEACQIDDIITGALALMKAELRNRQTNVAVDAPVSLPAVLADRVQIQQVLTNLITNSCDAMETLPPHERRIDISCRHEESQIVIRVEDTGTGLSDIRKDRLFEAFFTSKSEGMGLGLAICRDIVAAHGGTISAASASHRGAVFEFTLPVMNEVSHA